MPDAGVVIVLDGEQPASLVAVRSLGKRGVGVVVGASRRDTIAARSRHAWRTFVYPDPLSVPAQFRHAVLGALAGHDGVTSVMPLSTSACAALVAGRDELAGYRCVALASSDAVAVALSRRATRDLACRLGIAVGPGVEVRTVADGLRAAAQMGPRVLVAPDHDGSGLRRPRTVDRADVVPVLTAALRSGSAHLSPPPPGEGVVLAVLCRAGSMVWAMQYRRCHELDPLADLSPCRVSEPVEPAVHDVAGHLVQALAWDGAAELHFRRSGGRLVLARIAPALTEALPTAVAAGVDLPWLLYAGAPGERDDVGQHYRTGVRSRHLPAELAWVRAALRPARDAATPGRRLGVLADAARALSPAGRWDTPSLTDVRPGLQELRETAAQVWDATTWRLARARQRRRMLRAARRPRDMAARLATARTILFVCLGNIIRSAFAAALLRAQGAGPPLRIDSAGLRAATGHPADPTAVRRARPYGIDLTAHRTRRVDESVVEQADVLLAMELDHVVELSRRFPRCRHKLYLFGCLTGENAADVADPMDSSDEVFDACFERIDQGIQRIVEIRQPGRPGRARSGAVVS
jgi:protein-tyrosine-phosphatase